MKCAVKLAKAMHLSALLLSLLLLVTPTWAASIDTVLQNGETCTTSGSGTAEDPYTLAIQGTGNRITATGLTQMAEQDAIWKITHADDRGKTDYSLQLSGTSAALLKAPFDLDITVWQEREGAVLAEIAEKDSDFLPATLWLDVSAYPEFTEGTQVTASGASNARASVADGGLTLTLDHGGMLTLTAAGYTVPETEAAPEQQEGQQTPPAGETHALEAWQNGSDELPFVEQSGTVNGAAFNRLREQGISARFEQSDDSGLVWRYLAQGSRLSAVPDSSIYHLEASLSGHTLTIAQPGALPGILQLTVRVKGQLQDASAVHITGPGVDCIRFVANGYLSFFVSQGGHFTLTETGDTVSSLMRTEAKSIDESGGENAFTENHYSGTGYGSQDDPLTILGRLNQPFQMSWKCMNTVAGYAGGFNPTPDSYNSGRVMKVKVEQRHPDTGRLLASVYIDGAEWRMTTEDLKGPYYLDYTLNPSSAVIEKALENHALYSGKYEERRAPAVKTLTALSGREDTVLFYMSRTRDFAGPLHYTLDAGAYFQPGQIITVNYVLGSANTALYHGVAPSNAEMLLLEPSYSKYDTQAVVDADGYVTFTLYTGGFFTLAANGRLEQSSWEMPSAQDIANTQDGETAARGKTAGAAKAVLTDTTKAFTEQVPDKTETKKGALVRSGTEGPSHEPNFSAASPDGMVSVSGYLSDAAARFAANPRQELLPSVQRALQDGTVKAVWQLTLKQNNIFHYKMSEGEYLDVTLGLGTAYSIRDENLLMVRALTQNGAPNEEAFAAHAEINDAGQMLLTFRTTHVGSFAIVRADSGTSLESAVSVKQEYISEASTALAERSVKKPDTPANLGLLLLVSGLTLSVLSLISFLRGSGLAKGGKAE